MGRIGAAWRALTSQRDLASDEILGWRDRAGRGSGAVSVSQDRALRNSAWWACLRLRADLESSLPVDAFRKVDGFDVEVPKPDLLVEPMPGTPIGEHLYSSRVDLDRYGNSVGVIVARNAFGLPAMVDLAPMGDTTAIMKGRRIVEWRICGERYDPSMIWHERQWTVGGWPLGLSPLAYAAWTVGGYLSAQQFALDWFGQGATPRGTLKNTEQKLKRGQIAEAKAGFRQAAENGDIFVTGSDWEWTPASMDAAGAGFLEQQSASLLDVCRYLGVPGDAIDVPVPGSSITYANVTQRHLQLLVTNLGPAIKRRQDKWSTALPRPRYVKLNTDALLQMDPQTRESVILARVAGKTLAPSEARALDNLAPFTADQLAEISLFEQMKAKAPQPAAQAAAAQTWEVPA